MIKILFLAANPSDATRLAIDREVSEIALRLGATPHGAKFEIAQERAVRIGDLQEVLFRHQPDIVHFNGHGWATSEITVEDEAGQAVPMRLAALTDLFMILGGSIGCVVLNACYSTAQAEALREHVDYVVGMSRALDESDSIAFSGTFYLTLAFGRPIKTAFELGKKQLDLSTLPAADVPKLLVRDGLDAGRVSWVAEVANAKKARASSFPPARPASEPAEIGRASAVPVQAPASVRAEASAGPVTERVLLPNDSRAATFTGRSDELATIDRALEDRDHGQVFVLFGNPGVGKSRLALEYATRQQSRYPGGVFFIPWDSSPPTKLAELVSRLGLVAIPDEPIEDQCLRALAHLGSEPTLLVYDHVPNEETLEGGLPSAGAKCHVLVTSTSRDWSASLGTCRVGLLPDTDGHILVGRLVRDPGAARRYAEQIVERARGVAMVLCVMARSVDSEVRHRREASLRAALAADTTSNFGVAWRLLRDDARVLLRVACLFVISRIPPDALRTLFVRESWDKARIDTALDAARDRGLLTRAADVFDVHPLVADFIREQRSPDVPASLVQRHFEAFTVAAREFDEHPEDARRRARLLAYPLEIGFWVGFAAVAPLLGERAHSVGHGLFAVGRYDEAQRWYERAVEASQKRDAQGRVNNEQMSASLHQVGFCHSRMGRFDEAQRWYERAAKAAQKGDVNGRVNNEHLASSLHQVGFCYSRMGRFDEARLWYERAVEVKQRGDKLGRIDYPSLGSSLHGVGFCHGRVGRFDEARAWFESAVGALQQGDGHGRVDNPTLAKSVHLVGVCYASMGRFDEARPWFERAVLVMQKGDEHGRIDHQSVGKSLHQVGVCQASMHRFNEAWPWFERAVLAMQQGDGHGRVDQQALEVSRQAFSDCREKLGLPR
jgi:tetratricopeptide (TPR) repeat protein